MTSNEVLNAHAGLSGLSQNEISLPQSAPRLFADTNYYFLKTLIRNLEAPQYSEHLENSSFKAKIVRFSRKYWDIQLIF